jgi:hypothetical protein
VFQCKRELPAPAISRADALSNKIIDYRELIACSTAGFVGRQWVRDAVDGFLRATGPCCFLLLGEPGSGRAAIAARLALMPEGETTSNPPSTRIWR